MRLDLMLVASAPACAFRLLHLTEQPRGLPLCAEADFAGAALEKRLRVGRYAAPRMSFATTRRHGAGLHGSLATVTDPRHHAPASDGAVGACLLNGLHCAPAPPRRGAFG